MRDEVAGDETGESFGTGRMAAEVGQMVRVVVIVAYRALGIMVLLMNMIENGERRLRWLVNSSMVLMLEDERLEALYRLLAP